MRIIIIGAGLGGLTAAFCFARRGHNVIVVEQRKHLSPQGSGLGIRPGATRILHSWGLEPDMRAISDATPTVLLRDLKTGGIATRSVVENASEVPDWGTHRTNMIEMLYRKAIGAGVDMQFGKSVRMVNDDLQQPHVELVDGTVLRADMILAADGIWSRTRGQILGNEIVPNVSDITCYGIKLSAEQIFGNPAMAKSLTDNMAINIWMDEKTFVVGRWNQVLQVWSGRFGIQGESDSEQKSLWDEDGDIEWVRRWYRKKDTCPELMAALEMADDCDRWRLAEMPNLPGWSSKSGRIVLLGDSAHAMQPNAAQGYSMIVESIAVLEHLIEHANSHASERIPEIVRTWETIRKPRIERIKEYAKWNTAMFTGVPVASKSEVGKTMVKDLTHVAADMNAKFHSVAFVKWVLDFDAVQEAQRYLEDNRARL
ncbi:hypothetical protein H2198_003402 [Neophaeococcomyces mojaviensis]|uniref:Uncharacterized protein n=1 Tax=Neophaeococcomyces mojaviensis TaxID=3383035 RepID=A0ACC3ACB6_9EURO|nr:hypothetical protein H2198_003402 [Knufia sp. JES_112]